MGVLAGRSSSDYVGNWFPNVRDRYLGLTFLVKGKGHYGWARVSVETHRHPFTIKGVLTEYVMRLSPTSLSSRAKPQARMS